MTSRSQQCHTAIANARADLSKGHFSYAVSVCTEALSIMDPAKLNEVQRERLLLLRSEAQYNLRQYDKAIKDAQDVIVLTNNESPQAQFLLGRALLAQFKIKEAVEAFDAGEIILTGPLPERYKMHAPSEAEAKNMAWANVGVNPIDATGPRPDSANPAPRVVSYEWQQDLALWRQQREEARILGTATNERVVPRHLLHLCANMIQKQLGEASSRSLTLCLRNETTFSLTLQFIKFSDGKFFDHVTFPNAIPAGKMAIAGAVSKSWRGGVRGVVGYLADGTGDAPGGGLVFLFSFSNPLMGSYSSGCAIQTKNSLAGREVYATEPKHSSMTAALPPAKHTNGAACASASAGEDAAARKKSTNGTTTPSASPEKPKSPSASIGSAGGSSNSLDVSPSKAGAATATAVIQGTNKRGGAVSVFAQTAAQTQTFSVIEHCTKYASLMTEFEVSAVFDYLQPRVLKRCTAVNRQWRQLLSGLPPTRFYGLHPKPYPDYCCAIDFSYNNWTVKDKEPILWRMRTDRTQFATRDLSFYDTNDHLILLISCDTDSKYSESMVYYASRRVQLFTVDDSWLPGAKLATVRVASPPGTSSGRTVASIIKHEDQLHLQCEIAGSKDSNGVPVKLVPYTADLPKIPLASASSSAMGSGGGSVGKKITVYNRKNEEAASMVQSTVSGRSYDVTYRPGADLLMCSLLLFYAGYKAA